MSSRILDKEIHGVGRKLWKQVIDRKYHTNSPNIFCGQDSNTSYFWKGFRWAAGAVKLGYRWKVGKGNRIRFGRICGLALHV